MHNGTFVAMSHDKLFQSSYHRCSFLLSYFPFLCSRSHSSYCMFLESLTNIYVNIDHSILRTLLNLNVADGNFHKS